MAITHNTPTGPAGMCDICGARLAAYEGMIDCGVCEAVHCSRCASEAEQRGDYHPDAEYRDGSWINLSRWKGCARCHGQEEAA